MAKLYYPQGKHLPGIPEDYLRPATRREQQVAEMRAKGMKHKDIDKALGLKEGTSKSYMSNWYEKSGIGRMNGQNNMAETMRRVLADEEKPSHDLSEYPRLNRSEQEALRHLNSGKSNKGIAEAMDTTEKTVKTHLHRIFEKMGVKDRYQLIRLNIQVPESAGNVPQEKNWTKTEEARRLEAERSGPGGSDL